MNDPAAAPPLGTGGSSSQLLEKRVQRLALEAPRHGVKREGEEEGQGEGHRPRGRGPGPRTRGGGREQQRLGRGVGEEAVPGGGDGAEEAVVEEGQVEEALLGHILRQARDELHDLLPLPIAGVQHLLLAHGREAHGGGAEWLDSSVEFDAIRFAPLWVWGALSVRLGE